MMDAGRWELVKRLFEAALGRPAGDRATFVQTACGADVELRSEVESLLAAHADAGRFAEQPPVPAMSPSVAMDGVPSGEQTRLRPGARLGPYQIRGFVASGGMGDVYRAHDLHLRRDVALKILPMSFAADPDRVGRFEREARLLAALNHPHIAAIYGFEQQTDVPSGSIPTTRALVLEFVEGPTLAERLAKGALPITQALEIARQIAEALEAAHEKGIVHRDLKPANIKITPTGVVKVLDFGLAKAFAGDGSGTDLSQLPTLTIDHTHEGVIAGTPAYMSPEQARGQAVDKRADIWAFGCVLYEMLTAHPAFPGATVSDTIAAVLDREPDWDVLPREIPAVLRNILRHCLHKEPRQRMRDIGDVCLALEWALEPAEPMKSTTVGTPRIRSWRRALLLSAAIVTASVVAGRGLWMLTRPMPAQIVRWTMTPSGTTALRIVNVAGSTLAISPDGTQLAYAGADGTLLLRRLDQLAPTPLGGRGEPNSPIFSPDGQWIAYFNGNEALMKVATTGGPPATVTPISGTAAGVSWGANDTILFATTIPSTGLLRVPTGGGEPEVLTKPDPDRGEVDHLFPEVLPGGHAVLFTIRTGGGIDSDQIAVFDLRTRGQKTLVHGSSRAHYVPTGHLVYGAAGTLRAVGFDLNRLEVRGTPVPVLEQVMTTEGVPHVSISSSGTLVYVTGGVQPFTPGRTLVWVDRQGKEDPLNAPPLVYRYPRIAPDGGRVAVEAIVDIWIWEFGRETLTRFTFDPGQDQYPVWTPDGRRLLFRSERAGPHNIYWQAADGTGAVERLTESSNEQAPYSVSPDGTRLVFREDTRTTGQDLKVLTVGAERRAELLVQTAFNELNGEISPDGRWLAYQSNESGQDEIYVRPFPDVNGGRWLISTGGGRTPLWARSGKELFYQAPDGAVFGVALEAAAGATFRASTPSKLVEGRYIVGGGVTSPGRTYDVSPDGRRFLMIKTGESDAASAPRQIVVIQNWHEELKRLVPTR